MVPFFSVGLVNKVVLLSYLKDLGMLIMVLLIILRLGHAYNGFVNCIEIGLMQVILG